MLVCKTVSNNQDKTVKVPGFNLTASLDYVITPFIPAHLISFMAGICDNGYNPSTHKSLFGWKSSSCCIFQHSIKDVLDGILNHLFFSSHQAVILVLELALI